MKLTVKTLKGGKFTVDAEPSNTVAEVKVIIEAAKSELPAATMKLIHSGKVLKDGDSIESCNIKPNDFLVVMIAKAKKAPAPAPAAAAPAAAASTESAPAPAAAAAASASTESSSEAAAPAPAASTPAPAPAPAADEFPAEVIANLTGMGFPEAEVKACLRASGGNPDVAVEFLMNGIPPGVQAQQAAAGAAPSSGSGGSGAPLEALRRHPQFDALRRLVQSNPSTLQAVLTQIGQQQPELLQEINGNQAAFLEMMNEPIADAPAGSARSAPPAPSPAGGSSPAGGGAAGGISGMLEGMNNPAQMAQMLENMSQDELQSMAAMMGLTPEQLQATAQMIGQMPPEQFQQYMSMAMQGGGGMEGMAGALGSGGAGGPPGGPQVLRLNEEEMAAVDRLADMGFDRSEAAQAYLACDKNEALAANLLMDGGFGFDDGPGMGGGGGGGGGGSGGGAGGGGANDGDDMYD